MTDKLATNRQKGGHPYLRDGFQFDYQSDWNYKTYSYDCRNGGRIRTIVKSYVKR